MFPNLEAEQARRGHTDENVAQKLGISRRLYGVKKQNGTFKFKEIDFLLHLYDADFEYLFSAKEKDCAS